MRARNIKPGFFRNEQLLKTSPLGRLLFAGLWCLADREGRLPDRPAQIKWDLLPADDCDVNALLDELALRGFIRRYTAGDARYIEVTRFLAHQHPHPKEKASIIPPPPDTTPAQKHDSTRLNPDILNPDSLIPDSPIPDTLLPADTPKKGTSTASTPSSEVAYSLSDMPKKGKSTAGTPLSEAACSLSDMPSKGSSTATASSEAACNMPDMPKKGTSTATAPLSEAACNMPDMPKKGTSTASTASSEAKSKRSTDRKANYFFSRQDGNTNRSQPCKQVKHASDWVTGFFAT